MSKSRSKESRDLSEKAKLFLKIMSKLSPLHSGATKTSCKWGCKIHRSKNASIDLVRMSQTHHKKNYHNFFGLEFDNSSHGILSNYKPNNMMSDIPTTLTKVKHLHKKSGSPTCWWSTIRQELSDPQNKKGDNWSRAFKALAQHPALHKRASLSSPPPLQEGHYVISQFSCQRTLIANGPHQPVTVTSEQWQ